MVPTVQVETLTIHPSLKTIENSDQTIITSELKYRPSARSLCHFPARSNVRVLHWQLTRRADIIDLEITGIESGIIVSMFSSRQMSKFDRDNNGMLVPPTKVNYMSFDVRYQR